MNPEQGIRVVHALERIVVALEHGVERPEVRWTNADEKLSRIKELYNRWPHTDHSGEAGFCMSCALGKILDGR